MIKKTTILLYKTMNNIEEYKESLSELEKKALEIAEKNLESSFNLEKSIGYQEFLKSKEN